MAPNRFLKNGIVNYKDEYKEQAESILKNTNL